MSIVPLPVFEAEEDLSQRGLSEEEMFELKGFKIPESIIVRYGYLNHLVEAEFGLDLTPRCGTMFVVRTPRGTEMGKMLTTACSNSGCSKSITRDQILKYLECSGSNKFPFTNKGKILRLANAQDKNIIADQEARKRQITNRASEIAKQFNLEMEIIQTEQILGGERLTFYFMSENRVDFRDMVKMLAKEFATRIEMRQVGVRDEARLNADYERCGQQCCCKQFLKVLNPVSMRSAKIQKATLDPLKISGRCGRLLCCLRYEDSTYHELKKNLPHKKTRVGTSSGPGLVIDSQIITQLVLVELEHDNSQIGVPVEELLSPDDCPEPVTATNSYKNGNGNGNGKNNRNKTNFKDESSDNDLPDIFLIKSRKNTDKQHDVDEDINNTDSSINDIKEPINQPVSTLTKPVDDELMHSDSDTLDKEFKRHKGKNNRYNKRRRPRKPKNQSVNNQDQSTSSSSSSSNNNNSARTSSSEGEIKNTGIEDKAQNHNKAASEAGNDVEESSGKSRRSRRNRKGRNYKGNYRKQQPKDRPSQ